MVATFDTAILLCCSENLLCDQFVNLTCEQLATQFGSLMRTAKTMFSAKLRKLGLRMEKQKEGSLSRLMCLHIVRSCMHSVWPWKFIGGAGDICSHNVSVFSLDAVRPEM